MIENTIQELIHNYLAVLINLATGRGNKSIMINIIELSMK